MEIPDWRHHAASQLWTPFGSGAKEISKHGDEVGGLKKPVDGEAERCKLE